MLWLGGQPVVTDGLSLEPYKRAGLPIVPIRGFGDVTAANVSRWAEAEWPALSSPLRFARRREGVRKRLTADFWWRYMLKEARRRGIEVTSLTSPSSCKNHS